MYLWFTYKDKLEIKWVYASEDETTCLGINMLNYRIILKLFYVMFCSVKLEFDFKKKENEYEA